MTMANARYGICASASLSPLADPKTLDGFERWSTDEQAKLHELVE